ncbi:hypothetical protein J1C67_14590 [Clostridium gasigenes]|uniref:hypothetical protein n=1 Tax=Clostridium gasigenes TaxID=94869 RepID=UPI0014385BE7|nr:hypothetical protein [Clostridium gasigenes]NKF05311.1 hypothetical protein [Clostridium gasigenes]QSW18764.1 hypothetical protein J1C67_14590 [Clostridium gasigenes]
MNLSDIKNQALNLEINLEKLSDTIEGLDKCNFIIMEWVQFSSNLLITSAIEGNPEGALHIIKMLKKDTIKVSNSYIQALRNINFRECFYTLANLKGTYEYFNIDKFIKQFDICDNVIFKLARNVENSRIAKLMLDTFYEISELNKQYDLIRSDINQIKKVSDKLIGENNSDGLQIRLLNENNEVSNLITNVQLIQLIYNNINLVLGIEGEELKYSRVESGSLELFLIGGATTFVALKPMLEFGYKVYSEQFSKKSRLETIEKDIKVRGEYLKLLKEAGELKGDNDQIQRILLDLELNIKKLYSENPCIVLDNNVIGLHELKNKSVAIKLLEQEEEHKQELDNVVVN